MYYNKGGGFGFLQMSESGIIPDNKVMIHWREIQSDDRWPFLNKEMEVEFNLAKIKRDGQHQMRAKNLTLKGGEKVSLQEDVDEKRVFVGERSLRYLGNVKFYNFNEGWGYVTLQQGYDIDDDVPEDLRIYRSEITPSADGAAPRLQKGMEIEFGPEKDFIFEFSRNANSAMFFYIYDKSFSFFKFFL